jgi:hypothetical protein
MAGSTTVCIVSPGNILTIAEIWVNLSKLLESRVNPSSTVSRLLFRDKRLSIYHLSSSLLEPYFPYALEAVPQAKQNLEYQNNIF